MVQAKKVLDAETKYLNLAPTRELRAKFLKSEKRVDDVSDLAVADLRRDLLAAKEILVPQIHGLDSLSNDKLSGDAVEAINAQRRVRNARLDLINQVLMFLDALDDNGYPDLPPVVIPTEIEVELQNQRRDLESAFGIFVASPETGDFNPSSATKT